MVSDDDVIFSIRETVDSGTGSGNSNSFSKFVTKVSNVEIAKNVSGKLVRSFARNENDQAVSPERSRVPSWEIKFSSNSSIADNVYQGQMAYVTYARNSRTGRYLPVIPPRVFKITYVEAYRNDATTFIMKLEERGND